MVTGPDNASREIFSHIASQRTLLTHDRILFYGPTYTNLSVQITELGVGLQYATLTADDKPISGTRIHYDDSKLGYLGSSFGLDHKKGGYWHGLELGEDWILDGYQHTGELASSWITKERANLSGYTHRMWSEIRPLPNEYQSIVGEYFDSESKIAIDFEIRSQNRPDETDSFIVRGFIEGGSMELHYAPNGLEHCLIASNLLNDRLSVSQLMLNGDLANPQGLSQEPFGVVSLFRYTEDDPTHALRFNLNQLHQVIVVRDFLETIFGTDLNSLSKIDFVQTIKQLVDNINSENPDHPFRSLAFNS